MYVEMKSGDLIFLFYERIKYLDLRNEEQFNEVYRLLFNIKSAIDQEKEEAK